MDLKKAIYERRSVRKFKSTPVKKEDIKTIIDHGMQAPTACNIQGWKFIVIEDSGLRKWLVDSGVPLFVQDAPAGILVLYDNRTSNKEYKDNIQSAGATIQNMLLAAHSLGLGACWICRLPSQDTMRKMFKVPKDLDVVAYLAIGYPDFVPKSVPRKYKLAETTSSNTFEGKTTKSSIKRQLYLMAPTPLKLFYRLCVEGRFFRKFKKKK